MSRSSVPCSRSGISFIINVSPRCSTGKQYCLSCRLSRGTVNLSPAEQALAFVPSRGATGSAEEVAPTPLARVASVVDRTGKGGGGLGGLARFTQCFAGDRRFKI